MSTGKDYGLPEEYHEWEELPNPVHGVNYHGGPFIALGYCKGNDYGAITTDAINSFAPVKTAQAHPRGKSGARGVIWNKHSRKWQGVVGHNGRGYSAGLFDTVAEADKAVRALRNKLFTHNDLDRRAPV